MGLPDPHQNEPATELDSRLWAEYTEARGNREGWEARERQIRAEIEAALGQNTAGTVGGVKVMTYRGGETFAAARIQKDYPDLAAHFTRLREVEEFAVKEFAERHPDLAEPYRSRSFRMVSE